MLTFDGKPWLSSCLVGVANAYVNNISLLKNYPRVLHLTRLETSNLQKQQFSHCWFPHGRSSCSVQLLFREKLFLTLWRQRYRSPPNPAFSWIICPQILCTHVPTMINYDYTSTSVYYTYLYITTLGGAHRFTLVTNLSIVTKWGLLY